MAYVVCTNQLGNFVSVNVSNEKQTNKLATMKKIETPINLY